MATNFSDHLLEQVSKKSPLVIGIDPNFNLMPKFLLPKNFQAESIEKSLTDFCEIILSQCHQECAAVKLQSAYFEKWGIPGMKALAYALRHSKQLGLLTILDVKRGDIGTTSQAYAEAYLRPTQSLPNGTEVENANNVKTNRCFSDLRF